MSIRPDQINLISLLQTFWLQVEKESKSAGLAKEDALNRVRWRMELERLLLEWGKSSHPHLRG